MPMKTLYLADPITQFIKNHDSTWALMKASYELGHEVYYADSASLGIEASNAYAQCIKLDKSFFDYQEDHESKLVKFPVAPLDEGISPNQYPCIKTWLDDFNLIFMRKDPPVDSAYLHQCQILSLCKKAKVVNNPRSLINLNEKLSIFNFPDLIAPTIISNDKREIKDFLQMHKKIVIKPIDGKGGEGIFVVEEGDLNLNSIIETMTEVTKAYSLNPNLLMIQKYIPEIKSSGDKRIIMFNGKAAGALARIPAANDNRGNLAAGGSFSKYTLTKRDLEICSSLESFLVDNGIYFAGIDVIGDYLTEINITSPTCLQEINQLEGLGGKERIEFRLFEVL